MKHSMTLFLLSIFSISFITITTGGENDILSKVIASQARGQYGMKTPCDPISKTPVSGEFVPTQKSHAQARKDRKSSSSSASSSPIKSSVVKTNIKE